MKLPELTEKQIQTQVINTLWYKGFYVMRLNSGKFSVGEGDHKRFVVGQEAGTPDVMAFKKGRLLFLEIKRRGKKPTLLQTAKMDELRGYGAECYVIDDIERLGDIS